ncbi:unnamed protein product [Leuciscus chuanchicus]
MSRLTGLGQKVCTKGGSSLSRDAQTSLSLDTSSSSSGGELQHMAAELGGYKQTHRRAHLRRSFGLSPAGPHGGRPGHQALAYEPQPRAWLQGGAPAAACRATSRSSHLLTS